MFSRATITLGIGPHSSLSWFICTYLYIYVAFSRTSSKVKIIFQSLLKDEESYSLYFSLFFCWHKNCYEMCQYEAFILYCTYLVHSTVTGSERSPFVKRRCMMSSADSVESLDNASIASDTSDSSTVNPSTGKRVLPQPKLTVRTFDLIHKMVLVLQDRTKVATCCQYSLQFCIT